MLFPALGFFNAYSFRYSFVNDHHQYLACLGMIVLASAGLARLLGRWGLWGRGPGHLFCLALVGTLAGLTWQQSRMYTDVETLWRTTLAKNPACWLAHNNLGAVLDKKGQIDEAISQYQETIRLKPDYAEAHKNLGTALDKKGQTAEAINQLQEAIRLKSDYADAHNDLGVVLGKKGQTDEAISQLQEAIRLKPDHAKAHNNLGLALATKGQTDEAIRQYQEALRLKPDYAEAHYSLGVVLVNQGQMDAAIRQYQEAIRLRPAYAEALGAMAGTLDGQGKYAEAIRCYQAALKAQPDQDGLLNNLAWLLATCPDAAFRNGTEAVRLATRACELTGYAKPLLIGTLAAAQAEAGDFPAAIATAERAAALATDLHLEEIAAKNRELIQLYRQGQPFHEKKGR
jgi:tetratricopeptide (TPR) repeat protein